jgi:hypothetical protein
MGLRQRQAGFRSVAAEVQQDLGRATRAAETAVSSDSHERTPAAVGREPNANCTVA